MSVRTRFAASPTASLRVGGALLALANRRRGDWMLLRIDDTDVSRETPAAVEAIVADLRWLGIEWEEGPSRQSERAERHRAAAARMDGTERDEAGAVLLRGRTLVRADGTPTYHLASVVDDADHGITHVIRGGDHRDDEAFQRELFAALGAEAPTFVHLGLVLPEATIVALRDAGIPPEAVRAYLEELGEPRHDVHLDAARIRRLAVDAIAALPDEELAGRAGAPVELARALRGARDLVEARAMAGAIAQPEAVPVDDAARPTLERFAELEARGLEPRALVRELKAVGGDLKALRLALTGAERGPELWTVIAALPRDEALRRIGAAL